MLAGKNPPDVLITDINIPKMDGLWLTSLLVERSKKPSSVIVITSDAYNDCAERCKNLGAFYVRKGQDYGTAYGWRSLTH